MLRSAPSLLALAVLCVQVALAKIEAGYYVIQDNESNYLGIGPFRPIWPEVPARLGLENTDVQVWFVEEAKEGFIISALRDGDDYRLVSNEGVVFVNAQKDPETWAVTSVGENKVEIKAPYQDSVFTPEPKDEFQVQLRRAEGLPNQKWTFIRLSRDDYYHRGSRNRFCKQEQW